MNCQACSPSGNRFFCYCPSATPSGSGRTGAADDRSGARRNPRPEDSDQWALTFSLSSLPLLVNIMIYLVLVPPILVFFFLKDREMIGRGCGLLYPGAGAITRSLMK